LITPYPLQTELINWSQRHDTHSDNRVSNYWYILCNASYRGPLAILLGLRSTNAVLTLWGGYWSICAYGVLVAAPPLKEIIMSTYSLETEERDSIDNLFESLPQLEITKSLKNAMDEYIETVMDGVTDYMKDEYVLRFEDIALSQANKIVKHLLKGKDLSAFGLKTRMSAIGNKEEWCYDPDKIRESIVRDFKDDIVHAEMFELQKDNERLKEQLKWANERTRY